jgi:hypothetical protein
MAGAKLQAVADAGESQAPSARFDRGEITVDEYLEALVSDAVALVNGKLSEDRVEWLRGMLREQLLSDPVLRERVRQATGREQQPT